MPEERKAGCSGGWLLYLLVVGFFMFVMGLCTSGDRHYPSPWMDQDFRK